MRAATVLLALFALPLVLPAEAVAQRRGVARELRPVPGRVVVMRAYYAPLWFDPWLYPFGFGFGYGPYPPYPYWPSYYHQPTASLRIQAEPRETEVFVDGYFAGTVDDFDGFFQRLQLEPGEHEVTLYLAGHRTERQNVYLQPGRTFRLRHVMEALPPGAATQPRPAAPSRSQGSRGPGYGPPGARPGAGSNPPGRRPEFDGAEQARQDVRQTDAGAIAIRVQPAGADILIDGEAWQGPAASEQLVVQVAPGRHRIEVRREGYRPYTNEIEVPAGETLPLNVSLSRQ